MSRKRHAPEPPAATHGEGRAQAPVNVVVVVESGRRRRRADREEPDEEDGHPLLKTLLGVAVAKRLVRRRKRPLSKRVGKAMRQGRKKVKRTARKVRRALR